MSNELFINRFKGMTDYVFNNSSEYAEIAENIQVSPDGSLNGRWGSEPVLNMKHNSRVNKVFKIEDDIITISEGKVYVNGSKVVGPTGNEAFFNGSSDTRVSLDKMGDEYILTDSSYSLPVKLYRDNFDNIQLRSAGLPVPPQAPTGTPSNDDGKSYIYAIVYSYEYTIGSLTKVDKSSPVYQRVANASDFDEASRSIELTSIPSLSNGSTGNWDTANIKIEIYRTPSNSAATYYKLATIDNGITTYTDTTTDDDLILNEPLYTNLGSVENGIAPRGRYVFESGNVMYYLNVQDSGEISTNMGYQSIPNDPDSVPFDFFFEVEGALNGGGSAKGYPVVFTENKTYRLDGILTESGEGFIIPEVVSDTIGCISHDSIVKTNKGLYFAGQDGFYITDGYNVSKLTDQIDKSYGIVSQFPTFIQGVYCDRERRVRWSVSIEGKRAQKIFVFDERTGEFVVESGNEYFAPSALFYKNGIIYRGTEDGYLLAHKEDLLDDADITPPSLPNTWGVTPIIFRWKSVALDMGKPGVYKWFTKVNITGNPETNLDLVVKSYGDDKVTVKELHPTYYRPQLTWGDPDIEWGDSSILWNIIRRLNKTRRFRRGGIRSKRRQLELTNAVSILQQSTDDNLSRVTVFSSTNTASLTAPFVFFGDFSDCTITINNKDYEIVSNTSDTATLKDPSGSLVDGVYDYVLKGVAKSQRVHINGLTVYFSPMDNDGGFPGQQSNEAINV